MGTIDQKLNDYVWDNFNELKSIFSEKVYMVLLRFREKEDKEGFTDTLGIILDSENKLSKSIEKKINSEFENIENLSLTEIAKVLELTSYDDNIIDTKYINRAKYLIKNYKKEDAEFALLCNSLATIYLFTEKYKKAERLYLTALSIRKNIFGEEHSDTAISYNNLASLYWSRQLYEKAEPLYSKALEIRKNIFGEEHSDTAISYASLAGLYLKMKSYEKSEKFCLRAIKIQKKLFGEEHLDIANSYNHLASLYKVMEKNQESKKLYFKALEITQKILGKESFHSINIINNIDNLIDKTNFYFKINQIRIENFKQFNTPFSIQFSKQINIIIGQNAIGKTTLLQAITLGLLKENSPDEETSYTKYITKDKEKSEIEIIYQDDKRRKIIILKNRREIKKTYNRPFVLAYGSNFFTDYIESDSIVQEMLKEEIESDFAHTIFLEHTNKFWNPLSILRNLAISKHEKAKEKKETMFKVLNLFLEEENYALIPDNEDDARFYFIRKEDNNRLDLSQLSEGYRGNVLLITDMLIKILGTGRKPETVNAVVLIDEFDRHLHPKWQSKLVDKLMDVFPKIQFIMTTHNPMSILDRNPDEVTILKEIDGEIKAIRGRGTKNIGVSVVLLEYFNVDSTVGNTMSENINNFNRLKLKKELTSTEEGELKKLEIFLGETVASNVIFDRKYLKFLEFIRDHKDIDFDKYEKINENEMSELLKDFGDFFDD